MNELLGRKGEALRCPIPDSNWAKSRNVYADDARDIETVLAWIAASLMMGVYAADTAEEMFGLHGVPLVQRELVFSTHNPQLLYGNTGHYRAPTAAQRAVAATQILKAVRQFDLELHGFAVTCASLDLQLGLRCALTPELSRAALRPRQSDNPTARCRGREAVSA